MKFIFINNIITKNKFQIYLICILFSNDIMSQNCNNYLPSNVSHVSIVLLMGQSNMKGRGKIPEKQIENPQIISMNMTNDKWYPAIHLLHTNGIPDLIDGSSNAGVGPGLDFAEALLEKDSTALIALIPCAKGGSWIDLWMPGADLYKEALRRTTKALVDFPKNIKVNVIAALWLQGESDSKGNRYKMYEAKLKKIVENIRLDLSLPNLPFISATIGAFMENISQDYPQYKSINKILLNANNAIDNYRCVHTKDFGVDIGDNMHYDTASQQEIGNRYAKMYFDIINTKPCLIKNK